MSNLPTWKIITKNTFTLFNLVNLVLALMVAFVGSYKNMLFIFIAIANTLISIINELRAKKIIDKLKLIAEQRPTIIKDGKPYQVPQDAVKKNDLLVLSLGDQVLYDSVIQSGSIEVNEAFVTGEQDNIAKTKGDKLISGSFVVSGTAKALVVNTGEDNFVNKLQNEARTIKTVDSKLFKLMNKIVKYISYTLIPIGALLLWSRFRAENDTMVAVTSTVAALINMIPEGLILLTSSVLALATIRLSRRKVLVQDLYSIETLARVDCIALDKTGTLTTGKMTVHDFTLPDGTSFTNINPSLTSSEKSFLTALASILSHQTSENATITALKRKFLGRAKFKEIEGITEIIDFSSDRKYSGFKTKNATYLMGAIEFLTNDEEIIKTVKSTSAGYRTLAVVKYKTTEMLEEFNNAISQHCAGAHSHFYNGHGRVSGTEIPGRARLIRCKNDDGAPSTLRNGIIEFLGCIRLEDEIRPDATSIINYFYDNNIDVKIISGDDLSAVTEIAEKVGVKDLRGVDLSTEKNLNYDKLVKNYSIFTRVTPSQKKQLIKALKKQGKTVAMTGDGVNDILAMKEADVSLAIGDGSDAARRSAKLVLLGSDFSSIPNIIDEGRQSINNLERSTTLFLAKTVYASILAVIFVFLPLSYPFSPIEMSLLNFTCIGLPGLVLALEHNTERIKNRFTENIVEYSFPIGFTVSICMLILSIISEFQSFSRPELATSAVFTVFFLDLFLIYWISKPLNKLRGGLLFCIISIMTFAFFIPFARNLLEFTFLTKNSLIVTIIVTLFGFLFFYLLRSSLRRLSRKLVEKLQF